MVGNFRPRSAARARTAASVLLKITDARAAEPPAWICERIRSSSSGVHPRLRDRIGIRFHCHFFPTLTRAPPIVRPVVNTPIAAHRRSGPHSTGFVAATVIQTAPSDRFSCERQDRMPAASRQVALAAYSRQGRRAGNRPAVIMEGWHNHVDWAGLIEAIATRRDRAAFGELFSHFAPRVKGMLIKLGTAPELADDLAQETMLTVWRKAEQFDPSTTAVAAWIYTIARNLRVDAARKGRPSATLAEAQYESWEDPAPPPDKLLETQQDFIRVQNALAALPTEQAEAIRNAYYLDMSQADIADALEAPLGTVKSRVRLALKRLRALLDDEHAD